MTLEFTTGTKMTSIRKTIVVIIAAKSVAVRASPVPQCERVMRVGRRQKAKSESMSARNVNPHAGMNSEPHP